MFKEQKKEDDLRLEAVCSTCGKPIVSKARSDVTRFLAMESRCQCTLPAADETAGSPNLVVDTNQPQDAPWFESVIANLPENYEVLCLVGEGGMGAVFKVRDINLNKIFAIKVLRPELVKDGHSLKRFEQEAQAASGLTQVNLAAVYDYGVGKQGAPYLVMEFLDGEGLGSIIKKETCLDVPRAVDLFMQIADAVVHAHMKGVIHRDIKPSNIIIEKKPHGVEIAKLVDFGIAKVLPTNEGVAAQGLTQTGEIFGSPLYMSPEQCEGNKLDARSDIYAFGCVMYESLTGSPPFTAPNPIKTILKHIKELPVSVSSASKSQTVSDDLNYIVMRCLEKDPARRYQSMQEVKNDLQRFADRQPIKKAALTSTATEPGGSAGKLPEYGSGDARATSPTTWVILLSMLLGTIATIFLIVTSNHSPEVPLKTGIADAQQMDDLGWKYFSKGDYEKAIPLLEFAVKIYRGSGEPDTILADELERIGKCYNGLHQYDKALPYFREAEGIYVKYGNYAKSEVPDCILGYAYALRQLNRTSEADALQNKWNIH